MRLVRNIILLALGLLLAACGTQKAATLKGTVLQPPQLASDFALLDQHGTQFRLADVKGKVVLLSFIYTHCTDICPFITVKVKETHDLLGKDADKVCFVALTTDPARDTQETVAAYSQEAGLFDTWHYVTGTTEQMKEVWSAYGVGVHIEGGDEQVEQEHSHSDSHEESHEMHPSADPAEGLSPEDQMLVGRLIDKFGGGYEVSHSAPFWFIDRSGRIRAVMDADARTADIADNLRQLRKER